MLKPFISTTLIATFIAGSITTTALAQEMMYPDTIIILDASNSMWGQIGGKSKMSIAQGVIGDLVVELATESEFGLVAFGHRRSNDCSDIQLVLPVAPLNAKQFSKAVDRLRPRGRTPLTGSLRQAARVLKSDSRSARVILVSDGIESCGADPCAMAQDLENSGLDFTTHVIGFDLADDADQDQLSCIATSTGGIYRTAQSTGELREALQTMMADTPDTPAEAAAKAAAAAAKVAAEAQAVANEAAQKAAEAVQKAAETAKIAEQKAAVVAEIAAQKAAAEAEERAFEAATRDAEAALAAATKQAQADAQAAAAAKAREVAEARARDIAEAAAREAAIEAATRDVEAAAAAALAKVEAEAKAVAEAKASAEAAAKEVAEAAAKEVADLATKAAAKEAAANSSMDPNAALTLSAPDKVAAGSSVPVNWTGAEQVGDFVSLALIGSAPTAYKSAVSTVGGSPVSLNAPKINGTYELRFVSQGKVIARQYMRVTD